MGELTCIYYSVLLNENNYLLMSNSNYHTRYLSCSSISCEQNLNGVGSAVIQPD